MSGMFHCHSSCVHWEPSCSTESSSSSPVAHGAMDCSQNTFKLIWRYHQLLSRFIVRDHLPRVSRQSPLSANNRVIMRWYRGTSQISWHLPYSWGRPGDTSARRLSMKAVRPVISSNGVMWSNSPFTHRSHWKLLRIKVRVVTTNSMDYRTRRIIVAYKRAPQ